MLVSLHSRRAAKVAVAVGLLTACGDTLAPLDGGTSGTAEASATVLAVIDSNHFCDMDGVVDVVLRAVPQCASGEDECELPASVEGTVFTCPAIDPTALLAVEVPSAGRYRIAAVVHFTTGESTSECFSSQDGDAVWVVSQGQIDAFAQIHAAEGHEVCPDN